MENVGKAFTFVFDDEKWVSKVLLGALFFLLTTIMIGGPFVYGYMLETIRNVAEGKDKPLPDWDRLGDKFVRGLIFIIIMIIYALPGFIIYMCAFFVPIFLFPATGSSQTGDTLSAVGSVVLFGGMCFFFVFIFAFAILVPAITVRFAIGGSFGEAFRIGDHVRFIRENLGQYIIVVLLAMVASLIGQLGVIACFVGVFVTGFYQLLVTAHLLGQLYRASIARTT